MTDHGDDARLLSKMASAMHDETAQDQTAKMICDQATTLMPAASHASITIRARRGAHRSLGTSSPVAEEADRLQYELREGPCVGASAVGGEAWFRSGDVESDERWPHWGPRAAGLGIQSLLSIQLLTQNAPYGAVNLYSETSGQFLEADDVDRALLWATHAAAALAAAITEDGLHTAITSHHSVGVAQGILMSTLDLTETSSFELLTRLASDREEKLRDVAAYVVRTRRLPPSS